MFFSTCVTVIFHCHGSSYTSQPRNKLLICCLLITRESYFATHWKNETYAGLKPLILVGDLLFRKENILYIPFIIFPVELSCHTNNKTGHISNVVISCGQVGELIHLSAFVNIPQTLCYFPWTRVYMWVAIRLGAICSSFPD